MSNVDIRLILPEIKDVAEGSFIKNIYQFGDVFVLKLYKPGEGTTQLLLQPGHRIHLTEYRRKAPRIPPKFCSVLRKYLRDRRVHTVRQHDLDRIVIIEIGDEEESYKLVAELFGSGNLLLLDPDDIIFVAKRYKKMRDRDIVPKAKFEFPPPRGKDIFGIDDSATLEEILGDSKANVVRTLTSRLNLDSLSCEEICALSEVSPGKKTRNLTDKELVRLKAGIDDFSTKLRNGVDRPRIVFDDAEEDEEDKVAFLPFEFRLYDDLRSDLFDTYSQTIDAYFEVIDQDFSDDEGLEALRKEQKRLRTIIEKQQESIERLEADAERYRETGEVIYLHFQTVQEVLETLRQARNDGHSWDDIMKRVEEGKEKGIASAQVIETIVPSQGLVVLELDNKEVRLDIRRTPQDNATIAYEQAKRAESKTEGAKRQIEKTKARLEELDESMVEPVVEKKPVKVRDRKWYEKYRWFRSSEGHLVLGGRDAKTNERLAKRQMGANDVFIHAALHGAPYVIVKVEDQAPGTITLEEAASFAVTFSSAWQDGLTSGEAYWVDPEQVSFTPPSGEYLPTGAVMIYGSKNYIKRVPIELSVGVLIEGNEVIPMSGPTSAVSAHTEFFVKVEPGTTKKGDLVKHIHSYLIKAVPESISEQVAHIPQEDFMRVLPPGNGRVAQ